MAGDDLRHLRIQPAPPFASDGEISGRESMRQREFQDRAINNGAQWLMIIEMGGYARIFLDISPLLHDEE